MMNIHDTIFISETPSYVIGEIRTDIKPKYKGKTQLMNRKTKPFFSATVFYEKFSGLNLLLYREVMDTKDFHSYLNYIGEESIGIQESDLEVYYPEEG